MMAAILSEILDRKREVVARLRADRAARDFRDRAFVIRANATPHRLLRALESNSGGVKIIAEFKRRSPSAGTIRSDLSASDVATRYERGGACAISVLTDEQYFGGSILDLRAIRANTALPVLRKDFIIDEIEIYEAAAVGADAVLLSVAALDDVALRAFIAGAEDGPTLRMSCSHPPVAGPAGFPTAHSAVATADCSNRIQIKICGVTTANDARACVELGADMIGFNFYPASPRYVEPAMVRRIVDTLPARTCAVSVFVDADPAEIRKLAKTAGVRCVQLHGHTTPESCNELAREFRVIRALSTDTRFEPEHTAAFPECDVLIDAYHPELRVGTGQTCDWSAARAAIRHTRFLILSGGLYAHNVSRAIAAVMPHAVDVCSGIESAPGVKDHRALEQFISAVRAAELSVRATSTHKPRPTMSS